MTELFPYEKQHIMNLIFGEKGGLRPTALSHIQETRFFRNYNNTYSGYFLQVHYVDHVERWFFVRLEYEDDPWWGEQIYD